MADLNDFMSELEDAIKYLKDKDTLVDDLGKIATKSIKRYTPRRSGSLQESIKLEKQGNKAVVTSDCDYADDVEFGHSRGGTFVQGKHMFENGMASAQVEMNKTVEDFIDKIPLFK